MGHVGCLLPRQCPFTIPVFCNFFIIGRSWKRCFITGATFAGAYVERSFLVCIVFRLRTFASTTGLIGCTHPFNAWGVGVRATISIVFTIYHVDYAWYLSGAPR